MGAVASVAAAFISVLSRGCHFQGERRSSGREELFTPLKERMMKIPVRIVAGLVVRVALIVAGCGPGLANSDYPKQPLTEISGQLWPGPNSSTVQSPVSIAIFWSKELAEASSTAPPSTQGGAQPWTTDGGV